jgi:hypothetical protein
LRIGLTKVDISKAIKQFPIVDKLEEIITEEGDDKQIKV